MKLPFLLLTLVSADVSTAGDTTDLYFACPRFRQPLPDRFDAIDMTPWSVPAYSMDDLNARAIMRLGDVPLVGSRRRAV